MSTHLNAPLASASPLPPRPAAVSAAVTAMLVTAGAGLIVAITVVLGMHSFNSTFRLSVTPIGPPPAMIDTTESTARAILVATAVVAMVFAIVTAVLACGVMRANAGARWGAFAMSVLGTVAAVATVIGAMLVRADVTVHDVDPSAALTAAVVRTAQQSLPSWCSGLVGSLSGVVALGYIAVAILLALPAAKAYFGRVIQPWRPDVGVMPTDAGTPYMQR